MPVAALNPFELEHELKRARSLQKTPEGREAIRREFGVNVVLPSEQERPIVAILIPTHKKPENETGTALEKMIPASREACHVIMRPSVASSVVHWVRNQLLRHLYKDKVPFTHVLLMDDDMDPEPGALVTLLARDVPLIGAVCTVRQDPPLPNARIFNRKEGVYQTADVDRAALWNLKDGGIGTGFMLVKREVLEAVGEYFLSAQFERRHLGMPAEKADKVSAMRRTRAEQLYDQWWFEFLKQPDGDGEWGEDMSFCFKAAECGYDIYADSTVRVGHMGAYSYGLEDYWQYRTEALAEGKVVRVGENLEPEKKALIEVLD